MRRNLGWVAILLGIVLGVLGCSGGPAGTGDPNTIRDRTGKVWDVSHAVAEYGFVADQFQFGLGPGAIPPVFDPVLVSPGEDGYPAPDDGTPVIGVELNGELRAYSVPALSRREVINEVFGDAHVAVAY